jgi:hypothetical protein
VLQKAARKNYDCRVHCRDTAVHLQWSPLPARSACVFCAYASDDGSIDETLPSWCGIGTSWAPRQSIFAMGHDEGLSPTFSALRAIPR